MLAVQRTFHTYLSGQQLPVPDKKQYRAGGSVSTAGCHGAHFMPTVNRHGPAPSLSKAGSVIAHVPSLCQSAAGNEMIWFFIYYHICVWRKPAREVFLWNFYFTKILFYKKYIVKKIKLIIILILFKKVISRCVIFFLANFRTSGNINSISMHTPGTSFYSLMFIVDQSSWLF